MGKKPKKYDPEFKLNVVLETYATGNAAATADRNGVHITQITRWKKQLIATGSQVYETKNANKTDEQRHIEHMEKTISRLAVQNDILKKTEELLA